MDSARTYKKLPIEVQAIRWTGHNWDAVEAFIKTSDSKLPFDLVARHLGYGQLDLWIEKSKTWRYGLPVGDWIIAERDGIGFYPVTAEEFEATFEAVEP
jgi:hypothetical protein